MNNKATMFPKTFETSPKPIIFDTFVTVQDLYGFHDDYMKKFQTLIDFMEIHVNFVSLWKRKFKTNKLLYVVQQKEHILNNETKLLELEKEKVNEKKYNDDKEITYEAILNIQNDIGKLLKKKTKATTPTHSIK